MDQTINSTEYVKVLSEPVKALLRIRLSKEMKDRMRQRNNHLMNGLISAPVGAFTK